MKKITRIDIINYLIFKYGLERYLEIGTRDGECFSHIRCKHKECVDIVYSYRGLTHCCSSDEFFKFNERTYDLIFIDGNHEEEYVTRDIINSLNCLSNDGFIVLHDCNPQKEEHTHSTCQHYNGTVYKSIIWSGQCIPNINIDVVDTDEGCGIITKTKDWDQLIINKESKLPKAYYNFNEFLKSKSKIFNIISVDQFVNKYQK